MIKEILAQDTQLFVFINHLSHNFFLHSFFASISGIGKWGIIWIVISLAIFFWEKRKNHRKLVALFIALVTSSVVVEIVLKNLIKRIRPEQVVPFTIAIVEKSASYSFPSGHATIAFAAAFILGREHKRLKWFYYLLASLIAFSRVYLGKHFPSDAVAGAIIGLLIGYLSINLVNKFSTRPTKL